MRKNSGKVSCKVSARIFVMKYRREKKRFICFVKQGLAEIFRNYVQTFFLGSVQASRP